MEEHRYDVNLYFKVFGLAEREDGNPDYAGMKLCIGQSNEEIPYSALKERVLSVPEWKNKILRIVHLDGTKIKAEDIEMINPEEYDRDYGDDDNE